MFLFYYIYYTPSRFIARHCVSKFSGLAPNAKGFLDSHGHFRIFLASEPMTDGNQYKPRSGRAPWRAANSKRSEARTRAPPLYVCPKNKCPILSKRTVLWVVPRRSLESFRLCLDKTWRRRTALPTLDLKGKRLQLPPSATMTAAAIGDSDVNSRRGREPTERVERERERVDKRDISRFKHKTVRASRTYGPPISRTDLSLSSSKATRYFFLRFL